METAWDLVAKGKRTEAVAVLRQILKDTPQNGEAHLLLGKHIFGERRSPRCYSGTQRKRRG